MSELKREIGSGLEAEWNEAMGCFSVCAIENRDSTVYMTEGTFQNLIAFHAYVQTELASRQRLEMLPPLKETEA